MNTLVKNSLLLAMLSVSHFQSTAFAMDEIAAHSSSDPAAHPSNFTEDDSVPVAAAEMRAKRQRFINFLKSTTAGTSFLSSIGGEGAIPNTPIPFRANNPIATYKNWYAQQFSGGGASAAVVAQSVAERDAALAEVQRARESTAELGTQLEITKKSLDLSEAIRAAGGEITNPKVNEIIEKIRNAKAVTELTARFDDETCTFSIGANIDGVKVTVQERLTQLEYNRTKILIAIILKASESYNQASAAMGSLITEILDSAFPTPAHNIQIADLSLSTTKLKDLLTYHITQKNNLEKWRAFPLKDFFKVKFMSTEDITRKKTEVYGHFRALADSLPIINGMPLNSPALGKLLKKIESSIILPIPTGFSEQEVSKVLHELGLLLETDVSGDAALNGNYYPALYDLSQLISKALVNTEKNIKKPRADKVKALLVKLQGAIKMDRELVISEAESNISFDMASQLSIKGIVKANNELPKTKDVPTLSSNNAGFAVQAIKEGGKSLEHVTKVIFLLTQFCADQFLEASKKSIFATLDPALHAAFKACYGKQLASTVRDLKAFVIRGYDLKTSFSNLKGSENIEFIEKYINSVIKAASAAKATAATAPTAPTAPIPTLDWENLKLTKLGINSSTPERIKTALTIRTFELLYLKKIGKSLNTGDLTKSAAELGNAVFSQAVLKYDIQTNTLKTEADKKSLLESYFLFLGINQEEKNARLADFFENSLTENAKESDLVKLALELPEKRKIHNESVNHFSEKVNQFANGRAEEITINLQSVDVKEPDNKKVAERILKNIKDLRHTCSAFLTVINNATGLVTATGAKTRSTPHFDVAAGISQLSFEVIFDHEQYAGGFYGAIKTLHFMELTAPSDNDLENLKNILVSSVPAGSHATISADLDLLIAQIKAVREGSAEFYDDIKDLLKFVEDFNTLKTKYSTETGTKELNFYAHIDALQKKSDADSGGASSEAAASGAGGPPPLGHVGIGDSAHALPAPPFVVTADSVERFYTEIEINDLIKRNILTELAAGIYKKAKGIAGDSQKVRKLLKMSASIDLEPKYVGDSGDTETEGGAAVLHKAVAVPKIYGDDSALQAWINLDATKGNIAKSSIVLNAELTTLPTAKTTEKVTEKITKHYGPYFTAQIQYFMHVDYSKIGEDDVLHFVRQLMACIDLHLRLAVNTKIPLIIEATATYDKNAARAKVGPDKNAIRDLFKVFEKIYMLHSSYTIPLIAKAFSSPSSLNDDITNTMTQMLKDINPKLKEIIANTVIETLNPSATAAASGAGALAAAPVVPVADGTVDVITPVLTAINTYLAEHNSLSDIITLK